MNLHRTPAQIRAAAGPQLTVWPEGRGGLSEWVLYVMFGCQTISDRQADPNPRYRFMAQAAAAGWGF